MSFSKVLRQQTKGYTTKSGLVIWRGDEKYFYPTTTIAIAGRHTLYQNQTIQCIINEQLRKFPFCNSLELKKVIIWYIFQC